MKLVKLFLGLLLPVLLTACMLPDTGGQKQMRNVTKETIELKDLNGNNRTVIQYKGQADLDLSDLGAPSSTLLGATLEFTIAFDVTMEEYFKQHTVDVFVIASTQHVGGMSFEDYFMQLPQATYKGIEEFGPMTSITETFMKETLDSTNSHFDGKESSDNGGSDPQLVRKQLESVGVIYDHVEFVAPYMPSNP